MSKKANKTKSMNISHHMQRLRKAVSVTFKKEPSEEPEQKTIVEGNEADGKNIGLYEKSGNTVISSSATSEAQISGEAKKMAAKAGLKNPESSYTTPSAVNETMDRDGEQSESATLVKNDERVIDYSKLKSPEQKKPIWKQKLDDKLSTPEGRKQFSEFKTKLVNQRSAKDGVLHKARSDIGLSLMEKTKAALATQKRNESDMKQVGHLKIAKSEEFKPNPRLVEQYKDKDSNWHIGKANELMGLWESASKRKNDPDVAKRMKSIADAHEMHMNFASMKQGLNKADKKEIWQMTRKEYEAEHGAKRKNTTATGGHHPHASAVETAHNQGKAVPEHVLADYPELKKAKWQVPGMVPPKKSMSKMCKFAKSLRKNMDMGSPEQGTPAGGMDAGMGADPMAMSDGYLDERVEALMDHPARRMKKAGQPSPKSDASSSDLLTRLSRVKTNVDHGKKLAGAFESAVHSPNDPKTKAAYGALAEETKKQYKDLLDQGFKFSKIKDPSFQPYKNSQEMRDDVGNNRHLHYFPTEHGFGSEDSIPKDHPMLQLTEFKDSDGNPMPLNDIFRIVHDKIHFDSKSGFGPKGEHQAYLYHKSMYSPSAHPALAAETLLQNSAVNFGTYGEHNRANPKDTKYAQQKAFAAPDWVVNGKWHES